MKWRFKQDAEPQGNSDNFWYQLCNGYIKPEELLADKEQIKKLKKAKELIEDFEQTIEENGLKIEF